MPAELRRPPDTEPDADDHADRDTDLHASTSDIGSTDADTRTHAYGNASANTNTDHPNAGTVTDVAAPELAMTVLRR